MTVPEVRPVLRLVPNGLRNGRLRMTLIATPIRCAQGSGFPLNEWPVRARDWIFGTTGDPHIEIETPTLPGKAVPKPMSAAHRVWREKQLQEAWRAIVPSGESGIACWCRLAESIDLSLGSKTFTNGLPTATDPDPPKNPNAQLDETGAYKASAIDTSQSLAVKAVVPVMHGDLAVLLEFDRARRVNDRLGGKSDPAATTCKPTSESAPASLPQGGTAEAALCDAKRDELKRAIGRIAAERAKGAPNGACAPITKPDLAQPPDWRRQSALASHVAGSWPQSLKDTAESGARAHACEACDTIGQTLAAYQAIVSSPGWSRIFGFAFDISMEWTGTPPARISAGMWTLPSGCGPDKAIWTAVDPDGWPAPADPPEPSFVGEGLLRMGGDCAPGDLPRFDAVTLDVRQAAEAAARPLAGPKRGFRTSGLTLIDRYRADDVRRQIARADDAAKADVVTLHADDLLVGRRLDVGLRTKSKIAWRPLGARVVEYGLRRPTSGDVTRFEPIDPKIIVELLGPPEDRGGARTLEQAQINPASRLAPRPEGHKEECEVFVDEAFVTWDGAPMGVHTGRVPEDASPDTNPRFPFLQRQSLPTGGAADRPPPLRYGRSYSFGMRAVFLGGCSKRVDEASRIYARDCRDYAYPSDPVKDKTCPLRRFVRQEAIGAPVVLLPGSVLSHAPEAMDFETAQSAVLRSLPPGYGEPTLLPGDLRGRRYVKARERISGDALVRIFVPPVAALDELLRAGVFDDAGRRDKVAKGGLISIAHGVPTLPALAVSDGEHSGGFPIAVVDGKRAFEIEPTRRSLRPGWGTPPQGGEDTTVRGASLFIASAALGTKAGKFDRSAYYPDPHATKLILRLRRRSDGVYVGTTCTVPVYDAQSSYPDAMPIILVIRKRKGKAGAAGGPTWSKPRSVRSDGINLDAKQGQPAQRVDLTLGLGDDFDLEAIYLPDRDVMARQFALVETIGAYRLAVALQPTTEAPEHVTTGGYAVPNDEALRTLADELTKHLAGTAPNARASAPAATLQAQTPARALRGPIEELAAVTSVRVAHVVNRPLTAAGFYPADDTRGIAGFNILRAKLGDVIGAKVLPCESLDTIAQRLASVLAAGGGVRSQDACAKNLLDAVKPLPPELATKDYLLTGRVAFDRATTSAIEILATCVSPRDPRFDDPLRKRPLKARIAGTWPRKTHVLDNGGSERVAADVLDVYGFEDIDLATGAVTLKRSDVILLRIDNIAGPGAGALIPPPKTEGTRPRARQTQPRDQIDVGLAHLAALVGKPVQRPDAAGVLFTASQLHTFPDGKARKLQLRLRAISRFATDFETAPRWSTGASGRDATVELRQPLDVREQAIDSAPSPESVGTPPAGPTAEGMIEVWLPASRRPDKCAPLNPVPVFRFIRGCEGRTRTVRRRAGVRIYLERGWYSSGEGEQLGIVLNPGSASSDLVSMSDEELGPLGPYISRWGGDPTRRDFAPLATPLTAASFGCRDSAPSDASALVRKVKIPVQVPSSPGAAEPSTLIVEADVLVFTPCFDVDREEWFVDLDLQAAETPNLFARLGLIRFQPHAIDTAHQASEPVVAWTQLLPERTLATDATAADAALSDDGSVDVHAAVTGNAHRGVRHPTAPAGTETSALSALDQPVVRFRLVHESAEDGVLRRNLLQEASVAPCRIVNAHHSWETNFKLSKGDLDSLGPGTVYVYAEEVESFLPASYDHEPADIATIFKTLKEAGPRFAARLEVEIDRKPHCQ